MAFHDVRLPDNVEQGALGGPRFKTDILELSSGFEQRNIRFSQARSMWDIGFGVETKADFNIIIEFFWTRQGAANSFRFKDWSDFVIGVDATDTDQSIGTGDGATTTFQATRLYASGNQTFNREITKLVSGTVRVFLDSVEQFSGFTIGLLTGIITFSVAPAGSVDVGLISEFDVPARFAQDELDINMRTFDAGSVPNIPVWEVRGE